MKRISFFSWSLMLAVLVSGLFVTGCSEDEEEGLSLTKSDVVGFWEVYEATEKGETIDILSGYITINLKADGSYRVKFFTNTYIGQYVIKGNKVVGTTLDPITENFIFKSLEGNLATIDYSNSTGDKYIFKAKRTSSASNELPSGEYKEEVEFKLNYTFTESGDMTRAAGSEVYTDFYDKYIKTKVLTPTTYSLTFKNKETGATAIINGCWKNNDAIRLPEGEYEVTGTSFPKLSKYIPSDTVYIKFDETVNIKKDMDNLNLTAIYDSYLLLFDSSNSTKCRFFHDNNSSSQTRVDKALCKVENCYYLFIKDFSYTTSTYRPLIEITRLDKQVSTIYLNNIPFEAGKYYYFNDMTNSFDIPMMESGN